MENMGYENERERQRAMIEKDISPLSQHGYTYLTMTKILTPLY